MKTNEQYDSFVERVRSGSEQVPATEDFSRKVVERIAASQSQDRPVAGMRLNRGLRLVTASVTSIAAALLCFGILAVSRPWDSDVKQLEKQSVVAAQEVPVHTVEQRIEIYKQHHAVAELLAGLGR